MRGMQSSWSGKRGSNPRPPPWQGGALPLSYFRVHQTNAAPNSPDTALELTEYIVARSPLFVNTLSLNILLITHKRKTRPRIRDRVFLYIMVEYVNQPTALAIASPKAVLAARAASSGAFSAITPSAIKSAPSPLTRSSQSRIHAPPPQP